MPYIITTTYVHKGTSWVSGESRRAVATLEEARLVVLDAYWAQGITEMIMADLRTVESCTVGPLPDGTLIEVKRAGWRYLAREGGVRFRAGDQRSPVRGGEIIDAYNAREVDQVA